MRTRKWNGTWMLVEELEEEIEQLRAKLVEAQSVARELAAYLSFSDRKDGVDEKRLIAVVESYPKAASEAAKEE